MTATAAALTLPLAQQLSLGTATTSRAAALLLAFDCLFFFLLGFSGAVVVLPAYRELATAVRARRDQELLRAVLPLCEQTVLPLPSALIAALEPRATSWGEEVLAVRGAVLASAAVPERAHR